MDEQMFCFQCEQAANGTACTGRAGVCGKSAPTAAAQDRLTGALIRYAEQLIGEGRAPAPEQALLLMQGLFTTITNVNFDEHTVGQLIEKIHAACPGTAEDYDMQQLWQEPDPDVRSLKCFVLFSLRGMAAYNYHARVLGRIDPELDKFYCTALKAVGTSGLSMEELWLLVQRTGEASFRTMELLDHANTGAFGEPEPTEVPLTIEKGPFIVISGHDLYDTQQLLAQTEGKGINVYTHSELLPAHGYPELKSAIRTSREISAPPGRTSSRSLRTSPPPSSSPQTVSCRCAPATPTGSLPPRWSPIPGCRTSGRTGTSPPSSGKRWNWAATRRIPSSRA